MSERRNQYVLKRLGAMVIFGLVGSGAVIVLEPYIPFMPTFLARQSQAFWHMVRTELELGPDTFDLTDVKTFYLKARNNALHHHVDSLKGNMSDRQREHISTVVDPFTHQPP